MSSDWGRDGWVRLPAVLSPGEVEELRVGFDAVVDDAVRRARYPSREACLRVVQLWHDPWRVSPAYRALLARSDVAEAARALIGCERVRLLSQRLVVKPPDGRAPLPWHQDLDTWEVGEPRAVAFWVALDEVDAGSGGLRYLPGTHLTATPGTGILPVDAPVCAGDVLAHHPLVWHASGSNRSGRWRRACILAVADAALPRRDGAPWDAASRPVLPWAADAD